jgi:hypothetical protein
MQKGVCRGISTPALWKRIYTQVSTEAENKAIAVSAAMATTAGNGNETIDYKFGPSRPRWSLTAPAGFWRENKETYLECPDNRLTKHTNVEKCNLATTAMDSRPTVVRTQEGGNKRVVCWRFSSIGCGLRGEG